MADFAKGDRVQVHNPNPGLAGTVIGPDPETAWMGEGSRRLRVQFDDDDYVSVPLISLLRSIPAEAHDEQSGGAS